MYCTNCGTKVEQNDKYCSCCGNEINQNNNSNHKPPKSKETNISLILGIIACCLFFIPIISIPLAIIAIVLGITNRNKQKITGPILGIISIILTIGMYTLMILLIKNIFNEELKPFIENTFEQLIEEKLEINGNTFIADDNSIIEFSNDGSYHWQTNREDNYNKGTYTVYTGLLGYNYASSNLEKFNSYEYDIRDFYLIIMNPTEIMVDGSIITETNTVYYYGEYDSDNKILELHNHNTGKELNLTIYNNSPNNIDI